MLRKPKKWLQIPLYKSVIPSCSSTSYVSYLGLFRNLSLSVIRKHISDSLYIYFAWMLLWFKIAGILLIVINIRNYLLQKHIKTSWQFINFYPIYNSNNYSRFWCSPIEIILLQFLVYKLKLFTAKTCM